MGKRSHAKDLRPLTDADADRLIATAHEFLHACVALTNEPSAPRGLVLDLNRTIVPMVDWIREWAFDLQRKREAEHRPRLS